MPKGTGGRGSVPDAQLGFPPLHRDARRRQGYDLGVEEEVVEDDAFDALQFAKPVFGPATRKLAQLPITVDPETGYFISTGDFIEPVGPAYWERKS